MFFNYLKLSFRLLIRNPFFTFINILGLSIGFAAFYILWPYSQSELNSDRFHNEYDRIARLSWHNRWTDDGQNWNEFYHPGNDCGVTKRIAEELSEIKELTRVVPQQFFSKSIQGFGSEVFFSIINKNREKEFFKETNIAYAEPNFFQFFSFPLISGEPKNVLAQPYSLVVSEEYALKYFANTNPINAVIYLNDSIPLKVTGVFKDFPRNTHLNFDLLLSTAGIKGLDISGSAGFGASQIKGWLGASYIKVNEDVEFGMLERTINAQRKKFYGICDRCDNSVFIQPLMDIVFRDMFHNPFISKSRYVLTILQALSFIILALAWINYVSLSINVLHKRLPEMGARKVAGAGGRDFIFQFLVEAAIINVFSFLVALTLLQLVKGPVEHLFEFYIADLSIQALVVMLTTFVLGIIVTGTYPASISGHKKPIDLLKKLRSVRMPWWINSMVTLQYAAAVTLLVWIGCVYFQLDFILNRSIGIEQEGILVLDCPLHQKTSVDTQLAYFMHSALQINGIQKASISKSVVGDNISFPIFIKRNRNGTESGMDSNGGVDENFLGLYGIPILAGRNFQPDKPSDRKAVLISRTASTRLGFSTVQECIGATLILREFGKEHGTNDVEIIGVYDDYEFRPNFNDQKAQAASILTYKHFLIPNFKPSKISIKLNLETLNSSLSDLEKLYKSVFPQETFRWSFLDENINRHYANEKIARNQILLFTILAIGIACLGLLGMISNKVVEKTKEIGIRKVLGARLYQIAKMLLTVTIWQVMIAILIGVPTAYYLVQRYLEKFSDRIVLHWWHYVIPVGLLLFIMFVTIASVLVKAARTNPVASLRSE